MRLADCQQPDLIQFLVERKRQLIPFQIFVDGVAFSCRRRDADETDKFASDGCREVYVEGIERIAELAARVFGVLGQLPRVDVVTGLIDDPAFFIRRQSDRDLARI